MGTLLRIAVVRVAASKGENGRHSASGAFPAASSPDPVKHAAVLGPIKAKPCGWPRKTRPALTAPVRGGRTVSWSGRKNARWLRVEQMNDTNKKQVHGADAWCLSLRWSERRMSAEEIELYRIVVTPLAVLREGLVVTADLGEVGALELQGEVHQRVGDIGGGFIGDGIFG